MPSKSVSWALGLAAVASATAFAFAKTANRAHAPELETNAVRLEGSFETPTKPPPKSDRVRIKDLEGELRQAQRDIRWLRSDLRSLESRVISLEARPR